MTNDTIHVNAMVAGMEMYFRFSEKTTLLFREWTTDSESFIPTCVGTALLAAFYEGFKVLREYIITKTLPNNVQQLNCCNFFCTMTHLLQTILHLIQTALSYSLMLILMTFNVWLCISILIGLTFGYLVFGWIATTKHVVNQFDHCP